jgi:hypothetical protein
MGENLDHPLQGFAVHVSLRRVVQANDAAQCPLLLHVYLT